ncbi:hypothetical protein [Microtetraspora sp. NBRC 16547]|uniref:hypothetical protein n=1 Tax=Microtetraspora sp. NBRC 16547 TaxID=3030993 RepID=UPI0024A197DD|nr:hypothetical protein [Microtetraspora sp. NBRC 16547]GLX02590.1 hypothetical protein Misp02_66760 [Microtetraspora sp. NBRC 16547]
MLVPVPLVEGVAVAVVDVVHVIAVRHRHMAAGVTVLVRVLPVRDMGGKLALVDVIAMRAVQAAVVDVVDVIAVWYGDVPAIGPVDMLVPRMLTVLGGCGHWSPPR